MTIAFLICFLFLIDWFTFKAFENIFSNSKVSKIIALLIGPAFIIFALFFVLFIRNSSWEEHIQYRKYFIISTLGFIFYLPKFILVIFFLFNLLENRIAKSKSQIVLKTGFILAFVFLLISIWGFFYGRYNYKVKQSIIESPKIPESFNGFKIAQISDLHLGSYSNKEDIAKGLDLLQKQNPDIIVITGDIINASPKELEEYADLFKKLYAPFGKYCILGNHDMGDYRKWYDKRKNSEHIKKMIAFESSLGFIVLDNKNIFVKKGVDSIAIAGVLNWGLHPFKQYGKLNLALEKIPASCFCILASHDPSHWEAQVVNKTNVDLTLSGHTHGMQMGINNQWFKWSPVKYKYPKWFGLYKEGSQYLYVNQGFGTIGFNFRIGINPEITIFTLQKK